MRNKKVLIALLSIGMLIAVIRIAMIFVNYEKEQNQKKEDYFKQNFFAMDTYMSVQVYGKNAQKNVEKAIAEIERLDALLSTGKEDSEVSQINQNGGGKLSIDTGNLMDRAKYLYSESDGAFDISIYPVMKAWGFADKDYHVPEERVLREALSKVSMDRIRVSVDKEVTLPAGTEIDFGGIAKGYTADRVAGILKANGVESAMLDLGGNVQLIGKKPDGSDWKIAIQNPDGSDHYLGVVKTADKAIVTSGGYERNFTQDGVTYHHIIDPKTGYPVQNGLVSVTIVSADGTMADGLSTTLFVMGQERATEYWRQHSSEFDFVMYREDGTLWITSGLKDCFSSEFEINEIE